GEPKFPHLSFPLHQFPSDLPRFASFKLPNLGLTVGSLYQHGIGAYLRARTAWRTPVGSAPSAAFLRTGAQFVLFCNTSALDYLGKPIANDALWPRLAQKRPPVWLRQIGRTTEQGFRLYAVIAPIKAN
ncbi:MAG: hypothetical protein B7Z67_07820, partial [Acidiphilium sp. 21-60-14]